MVPAVNLQCCRDVRYHLAERFGRRANVDRLPVAVEHQHNCLVQDFAHKVFVHGHCASRDGVCSLLVVARGRRKLAASPGFAPGLTVSETVVLLITLRDIGKVVARKGSAPPTSGCRPDVILFHHRAEIGCGKWVRTIDFAFKERRVADYSIPQ